MKRDEGKSRSGMQLLRGPEGEEETWVWVIFEERMDEIELLKDAVRFIRCWQVLQCETSFELA